jgi:uncharacterized protein (TIGR00297 family)
MIVLAVGAAAALGISVIARRAGALSGSGTVAATICGIAAVGAGGRWAVLLIAFFVSSTLLSRVRAGMRAERLAGRIAKGGARDAAQVLANGGAFVVAAIGAWVHPHPAWPLLGSGALAASAADTWATEVGTLASAAPRSILDGRVVEVGTSGGVTIQGFAAAIAGAAFIGATAVLLGWPTHVGIAALTGGVVGAVADSVLGASLQVRRWCEHCHMATEQQVHRCGTATRVTGGLRWLDNDGVNTISSICGALAGAAFLNG